MKILYHQYEFKIIMYSKRHQLLIKSEHIHGLETLKFLPHIAWTPKFTNWENHS